MSQKTRKTNKVFCAGVGVSLLASVGAAMANDGVLVQASICEDVVPGGIVELGWLNRTKGTKNIYYMDSVGNVVALTPDAPELKNISNLRVVEHGSCTEVGGMTSQKFATALEAEYHPGHPKQIELATCNGGATTPNGPARVLFDKFNGDTKVMGYNAPAAMTGNGTANLRDLMFGAAHLDFNGDWVNAAEAANIGVKEKWDKASTAPYNQKTCTDTLVMAVADPVEYDFLAFVNNTVDYYSSAEAETGGYSITKVLSFLLQSKRTVCSKEVKGITGQNCITAP
ncbi:hypothetical protein SAMN05444141_101535 [Pseudovibrio denitrificans]|uniref:Uncharacterized protein n=1 Tax=Pseudovibrio denitrificans TaxID=258256 RepID=A0A1I6XYU7_9HYPH|nr:hypothetical protein [Pseudovibrio denitrificans]SFT43519.1 hypothetical protein SAMN05444141_101535 [Pseudovibrio denitrificans]